VAREVTSKEIVQEEDHDLQGQDQAQDHTLAEVHPEIADVDTKKAITEVALETENIEEIEVQVIREV
jgi:hypothetical protein